VEEGEYSSDCSSTTNENKQDYLRQLVALIEEERRKQHKNKSIQS
jgi:hypothetical protein